MEPSVDVRELPRKFRVFAHFSYALHNVRPGIVLSFVLRAAQRPTVVAGDGNLF